jgi:hypothetical protein
MDLSKLHHLWGILTFWSLLSLLLFCACTGNATTTPLQGISVSNSSFAIQVQSEDGLRCLLGLLSPLPNALVLDTDRRNFDDATIQQLGQYVSEASSLTSVPGGFRTRSIGTIYTQSKWETKICSWALQITNVGDSRLQIEKIQMQFHATPQNQPYHLIDICSLPLTRQIPCPPTDLGASPTSYTYNFDIGKSTSDRVVSGDLKDGYDPTLGPGNTLQMLAMFSLPPDADAMTYQIMPLISMSQPGKVVTQAIVDQSARLAIVTDQQLDCYTLKGNTFVPLPSIHARQVWCL